MVEGRKERAFRSYKNVSYHPQMYQFAASIFKSFYVFLIHLQLFRSLNANRRFLSKVDTKKSEIMRLPICTELS
jgi:hypothetical protein